MDSIMRIADIRIEIMGWLEEKDRWALFIAFLYENPLICNYTVAGYRLVCNLAVYRDAPRIPRLFHAGYSQW